MGSTFLNNNIKRKFLLITGCSVLIMFIFFGPTDNWMWDPSFYYAQIRSPIIDNDLDFRNETQTGGLEMNLTRTELIASPWPIGPGILWSPFFLVAHIITLILVPSRADGFSQLYISLVSIGSIFYGALGLLVIFRICRFFGDKYISILTSILCLGATPLFYYSFRQPIMAHTTNLLFSGLIVLIYLSLERNQIPIEMSGILFGVVLGLNFLTRWSGLIIGFFPLAYYLTWMQNAITKKDNSSIKSLANQLVILFISFCIIISPQLVLWFRLHNRFILIPQSANTFVQSIIPINFLNVFFHTNRGLLFWAPFILIGFAGLFWISDKKLKIISIVYLTLLVILIGYRVDWYGGGGFGTRYFIEALPILSIGFVSLVGKYLRMHVLRWVLLVGSIILVGHQYLLMYATEHGINPGWLPLERYYQGQYIGLGFQIKSLKRLLKQPSILFLPRPFVADDRQTILVSLLSGVRDLKVYFIPGIAMFFTPLVVFGVFCFKKITRRKNVILLTILVLIYLLIWSIYLLIVGRV